MGTIYQVLKQSGVDVSAHHESELYVPDDHRSRKVIAAWYMEHPQEPDTRRWFTCELTGEPMIELPFQYDPFWEAKNA